MAAPTFPLTTTSPTSGQGVTLALTTEISPENPIIGDLDLQGGQVHLWDKRQGRAQKIRMILQFGLGEHWLNPDEGIPWFQQIIGRKTRGVALGLIRQAFQRGLPDLAEVRRLTMELNPVTRAAPVDFELRFNDGMTISASDFSPVELQF